MSTPADSSHENPQTYFVQDQFNQNELQRLQLQGQMLTASMGGALAEQPDPTLFQRVLDVACGTGDWLIEAAKTYPTLALLVGVDINSKTLGYAQTQAIAERVADRVQFGLMDVLLRLEFPIDFFDLVNQRLGQSYLRTWEWLPLLGEFQRVCRPGGVIRVTEVETVSQSSSPAVVQLSSLFTQALHNAGHYYVPETSGITSHLARLLQAAGLQEVQSRAYVLECRAGTVEGERFAADVTSLFRIGLPFFRKWADVPENYEEIYQQALREMLLPDFVATWNTRVAWGKKHET